MAVFKTLFFSIIFVLFGATHLRAQADSVAWRYGAFGSFGFNFPQGNFASLPGVFKSARAEDYSRSGFTTGFSAGFSVLKPIFSWLNFAARIDYQSSNTLFSAREAITYIDTNGNRAITTNEYSLSTNYTSFGIQPEAHFPLFKNFWLISGLHFGFKNSSSFTQSERITDPPEFTFTDGQDDISGELPGISNPQISLVGGITFPLLFKNFEVRPEIIAQYSLTQMLESSSWRNFSLRGGISFLYAPQVEPFTFLKDTIFRRDTSLQLASIPLEEITLTGTRTENSSDTIGRTISEHTTIFENYLRTIPRPEPILSAQISAQIYRNNALISAQTIPVRKVLRCQHIIPKSKLAATIETCDTLLALDSIWIFFGTDIISENEIHAWEVRISRRGALLKTLTGSGKPPRISWQPEILPEGKLDFAMWLKDSEGQEFTTETGTIELQSRTNAVTHMQHVYTFEAVRDAAHFLKSNDAALREVLRYIQPEGRVFLKAESDSFKKQLASLLKIPASRIVFKRIPAGENVEIIVEN